MKRLILLTLSILAGSILLSSSVAVKAAGGDLDPTFNPGTGTNREVDAITLQPDGKIIVGGFFSIYNGSPCEAIVRLNPDGTLDPTFDLKTNVIIVHDIRLQPDGKILIGGSFDRNIGDNYITNFGRLNPDGSFDTTFDTTILENEIGTNDVHGIALQPDGKIIIGGEFFDGSPPHRGIIRLNPNGSIDKSFRPDVRTQPNEVEEVVLQPDGKMVIAGIFSLDPNLDKGIVRLNSDGSLDTTFDPGLGVDRRPQASGGLITSIALQPDGKLVIGGGFRGFNGTPRFFIARLNSDGSLDATFDPKGVGASGDIVGDIVRDIKLQPDGKIIIGGDFIIDGGSIHRSIARLNSDGSLDTSFNLGTVTNGVVNALAIQANGRIVIGGEFNSYNGVARNNIARLLSDLPGGFSLSSPSYIVNEGGGRAEITVNRFGDLSKSATVDYATKDTAGLTPCNVANGLASPRCDYAMTVGTLRFAPWETSKTIYIPIVDDGFVENSETFNITLSNTVGSPLDSPSTATVTIFDNDIFSPNPIDDNGFFIRQLYIDFLSREPDPPGFNGWLNILNNCSGSISQPCDRTEVASAFFRSPEFQDRGYFIYRVYRAGLGRIPHYGEFIPDMAKVSGFLNAQELEANKTAFVREFTSRPEFQTKYSSLSNSDYVNALSATALVTLPNKQALINDLQAGRKSRADVLRAVIETSEVYAKYFNEAFIVMEYFGFLRRDPDAAFQGWIDIFNHTNSYRLIINGFINSAEYRQRFGN